MMEIKSPYWHPSAVSGFLLDWDGVIAETKLDFTGVRQRYYGGRNAYLLEEADTLSPDDRKGLMDDKLPHRPMLEVELADAVIRVFDMAGGLGLDVAGAIVEKLAFNATRKDHTPEARRAEGGKRF